LLDLADKARLATATKSGLLTTYSGKALACLATADLVDAIVFIFLDRGNEASLGYDTEEYMIKIGEQGPANPFDGKGDNCNYNEQNN
jgi:hypothetical protein